MFKKFFVTVCIKIMSLSTLVCASDVDFITYEWLQDLGKNTSYTDHVPHFRRLFNTMNVRGFLECGCGFSTKYFMDNCKKVVSIEFMMPGTSDLWFNECLKLYQDCPNWIPLAYNQDFQDVSFNEACGYACATHQDYELIDPSYMNSMDAYFKERMAQAKLEGYDIDVAFVDAGVYTRGDMVKVLLANKVPVVLAHDTASDDGSSTERGLYGWFKVVTPQDYVKVYIPWGQGTTFWIRKDMTDVVTSISAYRNQVIQAQNDGGLSTVIMTEIADHL